MPDEIAETQDQQEQQDQAVEQPDDEGREHLRDEGKKALDRMKAQLADAKREAKANLAAAARLKEIEDASKSEIERATERAATFERELTEARAEGLRLRIAAKFGIGEEDADLFLTGSDEESLTRQAERLQAREQERAAAASEKAKNGLQVAREGLGVNAHDDKDSTALSVLGFG